MERREAGDDAARDSRIPRARRDAFASAVAEDDEAVRRRRASHGATCIACVGKVDVPVGGCSGALGCFRVLNFADDPDGKRAAIGGDGWILAIEFGKDLPRAYSVLAYGESPREDSPYHSDQAGDVRARRDEEVAFTPADVDAQTVKRYNPGTAP